MFESMKSYNAIMDSKDWLTIVTSSWLSVQYKRLFNKHQISNKFRVMENNINRMQVRFQLVPIL